MPVFAGGLKKLDRGLIALGQPVNSRM